MPNLQPPITQVSQAVVYHKELSRIAPEVKFLMSLFLHPSFLNNADAIVAEAARSKIIYGASEQVSPGEDCNADEYLGKTVSSRGIIHHFPDSLFQFALQSS